MSEGYGKMKFARIEDHMLVDGFDKPPQEVELKDDLFDPNLDPNPQGPRVKVTVIIEAVHAPDHTERASATATISIEELEDHILPPEHALREITRAAFAAAFEELGK